MRLERQKGEREQEQAHQERIAADIAELRKQMTPRAREPSVLKIKPFAVKHKEFVATVPSSPNLKTKSRGGLRDVGE